MFHRVDEPMDLPSSRFFRMAERLHLRGGALAAALSAGSSDPAREEASIGTPPGASSSGFVAAGTAEDIAAMAAMSQNNSGFPGVGYIGG